MANPVTHIIVPMLLVETYRRYFAKRKFSSWYVFLAGFIGAAPDFDFILSWLITGSFDLAYHRNYSHSLLILIAALAIGLFVYILKSKRIVQHEGWRIAYIVLFMTAIGVASHTLLDGIDGMHYWFYPLDWYIALPNLIYTKYRAAILDGALMLIWLLYQEEMFSDITGFFRKLFSKKKTLRKKH